MKGSDSLPSLGLRVEPGQREGSTLILSLHLEAQLYY